MYGLLCLIKPGNSGLLRNRPFEVILLLNMCLSQWCMEVLFFHAKMNLSLVNVKN